MGTRAPCLMVEGTGSGVGKSLLVTALCRLFARAGYRGLLQVPEHVPERRRHDPRAGRSAAPRRPRQRPAGIEPTVDVNPILLKPEADDRSQVVVRGVAERRFAYREYAGMRSRLLEVIRESLERLRAGFDLEVIEGAGSPAEINLADTELVNMSVARMADAPVLLVGDIDRGGVFAALLRTLDLPAVAKLVELAW
ncbi:MAG: AAA family ATPase [Candidatus Rokubacteria bacterium]|nr:AAA family ATPase [Candidatus Rokubacteria bacterium]